MFLPAWLLQSLARLIPSVSTFRSLSFATICGLWPKRQDTRGFKNSMYGIFKYGFSLELG